MMAKYFSRLAKTALFAAAFAAVAPSNAHAAGFNATLEGQSRSLVGTDATLPAGQGKGDGAWTTGGLSFWREGDWIPVRVNLTGGPVANQQIVVQLDYGSGTNLGEAGAFTYVAAPIPSSSPYPAGSRPASIPTTNPLDPVAKGLQGTGTVSAVQFVSISPVSGTTTTTLSYTFNVTMTGATGTVQFMARLASGSHNFGGSSLQIKGTPSLGTLGVFKPSAAPGNPDLTVMKSGPSTAAPGQTVTYTLNYSNIAPKTSTAGSGVQVVDTLPTGLSYVSGSATCTSCIGVNSEPTIISNTLNWDVANLQPGATASPTPGAGSKGIITFNATVDPSVTNGTPLTNTAQIYCAEDDVNHSNDSSMVTTTVSVSATNLAVNPASGTYGGKADLSAKLTIGGTTTPLVGRTVTFTLNGNSVCGGPGQTACPTTLADGTATLAGVYLTTNGLATGGTAFDVGTYATGIAANYAGETGPPKYDGSSGQASLTISKATLVPGTGNGTISITGYNVTYDGNAHTATGIATGVLGENLSSLLDLSGTIHTNAASYPTDAWSFSGNSNYNSASGTVADAIAKGAPGQITIAVSGAASIPYGTSKPLVVTVIGPTNGSTPGGSLTAGNADDLFSSDSGATWASSATCPVSGTLNSASCSVLMKPTHASLHTVAASFTADPTGNYADTTGSAQVTVDPAPLTITAASQSKNFGTAVTPAGTEFTTSALYNSDSVSSVTLASSGYAANAAVGSYGITPSSASGSGLGSYVISYSDGTLAVNKADLPIGPPSGSPGITVTGYSVTFNGASHTAAKSAKGFFGEDLTFLVDVTGTTHTDAGTYNGDAWAFAGNSNYNSASGAVNDAITKATLTPGPTPGNGIINIVGYSVTYDGNSHTATGTATGVTGEDLSSLLTLSGTTHTAAGTYNGDAWSFAGNGNYNAANGSVNDAINKATLTPGTGNGKINITGYNVTYDGNAHTATGTATGLKGENLSSLLNLNSTTHTASGSYGSDAWSFAGDSNYNSSSGTVADQIGGKTLHVSAAGVNRVYDGTTAATVTLSTDAVSGDAVTAAYTGATFANRNVGAAKPVSVTGISISGAQASNYALANTTATTAADITKRPITVTAQPDTKLYDGTTTSKVLPKVTSGTIVGSDTANFTQSFSSPAAGKPLTLTPSGSVTDGNTGANYAYTFVPLNVPSGGITVRTVTPTITAASKTYDGTAAATIAARSISGVLTGETVALAGGTATFSDANAGSGKTVTAVNLTLSGADAGNYALSSTTATANADIFKASQSISFAPIPNQVLNIDGPLTVSPTASSGLPVALALKSGPATVSGNTVTVTSLGKVTLTASQPGDQNYDAAASVDQTFNVVPPPALLNISTRGRVGTGDNVLIGGYIVKGVEPKTFAARGIGPSIKSSALPQTVIDPLLELHGADGKVLSKNDNWQDTQATDIQASGLAPANALESMIIATTAPGNYTAIVSDKANANLASGSAANVGIGMVELYDLSQSAAAVLANISTRGVAGSGDDVMIGGFIVNGKLGSAKVIMRAIGPSLAASGVANTLPDPTLELRDKDGVLLASNDNWQDDATQAAAIQDTTIPPGNPKEAAIVISLPPANYTFIVKDKNGTSGVALAEVYDLTN